MFRTSNSLWPCWHIHGTLYIHWFQKYMYHLHVFSRYWSSTVVVLYYIHVPLECFRMKKKIFNFVLHLAVWRMEAFLFNYTLKSAFLFILNLMYFWYRWLREINVCKILVDLWNLEHYGMFVSFWKKKLLWLCRNPWSVAVDFVPVDPNRSVVLHGGEESDWSELYNQCYNHADHCSMWCSI